MCEKCENLNLAEEKALPPPGADRAAPARAPVRFIEDIFCPITKDHCRDNCAVFDDEFNACGLKSTISMINEISGELSDLNSALNHIRTELRG